MDFFNRRVRICLRRQGTTADAAVTGIILADIPVTGSVVVYKADDDCGTELECTVSDKAVTLGTALSGGSKVVIYYMKEVTEGLQRINIKSTSFPGNFIVYGDTVMKTKYDEILPSIHYLKRPANNSIHNSTYENRILIIT